MGSRTYSQAFLKNKCLSLRTPNCQLWTHSELPGAVSVSSIVPAQSQATWVLTDGAWELRMRPQLVIQALGLVFDDGVLIDERRSSSCTGQ